ncbi:helix-turn-helix domain-containing protein [Streptomyces niveus]
MARSQTHRALPAELLASAEWQEACRGRDFARIFRLVKVKAGIYPSRIAALCGMTPSRVGEIMAGRRGLAHIDVIERVADGLCIPGALLGLWPTGPGRSPPRPAPRRGGLSPFPLYRTNLNAQNQRTNWTTCSPWPTVEPPVPP